MRNSDRVKTTDAEIDEAIAKGREAVIPHATVAMYLPYGKLIAIRFSGGAELRIPADKLQGLQGATKKQLSDIVIQGPGSGLYWPLLDVAHYIPGLLDGVYGTRHYMQEMGRAGGSKTSKAKAAAARENGKKSLGRPKKAA